MAAIAVRLRSLSAIAEAGIEASLADFSGHQQVMGVSAIPETQD